MAIDSVGSAQLLEGTPSTWGFSSRSEVLASVGGLNIPLYYSPNSFGGGKYAVVDAYLGMKDGPIAAEVASDNSLTVIFKGGYPPVVHLFVERFNLSTGVAESRYNFATQSFDQILPGDMFWQNGTKSGVYRADYVPENYPGYVSGYNNRYYQALKLFEPIINPSSSSSSSSGGVQQTNPGIDSLTGKSMNKDTFYFSSSPEYGSNVDKITNFSAKDKDTLQISKNAFGVNSGKFAIAKNLKKLNQLLASDANFIYNRKSGELIFNANSVEAGFGDTGGVFAQLIGNPKLIASSVSFI
jgi:hypothetical protein